MGYGQRQKRVYMARGRSDLEFEMAQTLGGKIRSREPFLVGNWHMIDGRNERKADQSSKSIGALRTIECMDYLAASQGHLHWILMGDFNKCDMPSCIEEANVPNLYHIGTARDYMISNIPFLDHNPEVCKAWDGAHYAMSAQNFIGKATTAELGRARVTDATAPGLSARNNDLRSNLKSTDHSSWVTCPYRHALENVPVRGSGTCDGCGKRVQIGEPVMDCRQCNWYLCRACHPGHAPQDCAPSSLQAVLPEQSYGVEEVWEEYTDPVSGRCWLWRRPDALPSPNSGWFWREPREIAAALGWTCFRDPENLSGNGLWWWHARTGHYFVDPRAKCTIGESRSDATAQQRITGAPRGILRTSSHRLSR